MNKKEARALADVARQLRLGPGNGWHEYLTNSYTFGRTPEEREQNLRLWLTTWILPPIDAVVTRYNNTRKPK